MKTTKTEKAHIKPISKKELIAQITFPLCMNFVLKLLPIFLLFRGANFLLVIALFFALNFISLKFNFAVSHAVRKYIKSNKKEDEPTEKSTSEKISSTIATICFAFVGIVLAIKLFFTLNSFLALLIGATIFSIAFDIVRIFMFSGLRDKSED